LPRSVARWVSRLRCCCRSLNHRAVRGGLPDVGSSALMNWLCSALGYWFLLGIVVAAGIGTVLTRLDR
jgi:hypothetical protein